MIPSVDYDIIIFNMMHKSHYTNYFRLLTGIIDGRQHTPEIGENKPVNSGKRR